MCDIYRYVHNSLLSFHNPLLSQTGGKEKMSSELGVERPTSLALSEAQGVERRVHFNEVDRPHLVATTTRQNSTPSTPSPR